jgi:membrane protein
LSDRPALAGRARAELWLVGRAAWQAFVRLINGTHLTHASSVAYGALLSLFPAFLLAFAVFGVVTANDARRAAVVDFFLRYFPARFQFVTRQLDSLARARLRIGIGGVLALVWAAQGVFSALTSAINYAWQVEKPRSYLKHKLFSMLMLATAGVLLLAALVLASVIQIVHAGWFAGVVAGNPRLDVLGGMALNYVTTAMLIVVVALIYAFVPSTKVRLRDVWVGAIITGLVLRIVLEAFAYYVRDLSRLNAIHGSIAAVIVFLIWVYSSAVVLIYGAEFTATHIRLRQAAAPGQS